MGEALPFMSLIEEALAKAEKEKEDSAEPVPSRLSGINSLPKNRDRRSPFRVVTAIVAVLCIVVSVGWLAYWWFQSRSQHHPRMISPDTEATPLLSPEKGKSFLPASPGAALTPVSPPTKQATLKKTPSPHKTPENPTPLKGSPSLPAVIRRSPQKPTAHKSHRTHTVKQENSRYPHHKRKKHTTRKKKVPVQLHPQRTDTFRKAEKAAPISLHLAREAIEKGLSAYRAGDLQRAACAFEKSLTYAEPTAQTLAFLGGIYLKLRDYDKAYTYLKRAFSQAPSNPGILEKMGITLMARGEETQAIPFFLRAIQAHPFRYTSHVNLGIAYWKSGNLGAARDQFLTAIKIRKDRPEAYYNLSGVYEAVGDYPRALSSLESFMKRAQELGAPVREEAKAHIEALKAYLQKNGGEKNHD